MRTSSGSKLAPYKEEPLARKTEKTMSLTFKGVFSNLLAPTTSECGTNCAAGPSSDPQGRHLPAD